MACRQVDNIPKYPRRSSAQFSITDVTECSTDHFVNDLNEDWDAPANFENEQSEEDECIDNFRAERFDDFQAISDQSKICFVPNSTNQTESHAKAENPSLLSDDSVKGNENQLLGCDYETVFTNSKAGMDGVDKDYVKKVVFEMSRSSDFFRNEQRKDAIHRKANEQLSARVAAFTAAELSRAEAAADRYMERAEAGRDLSRRFIHVDMDMFFAAVEQLRRPELAQVPMAVGGLGMISTANYVARKYGVRSAMPGFIGKVRRAPAPPPDAAGWAGGALTGARRCSFSGRRRAAACRRRSWSSAGRTSPPTCPSASRRAGPARV